ncbi:MAG: DUF521 domain-containing protein [Deltaproteobacteria bacterium]|nr:DUF521 domain-containing protein [Deltaproteobacteria bacterium]
MIIELNELKILLTNEELAILQGKKGSMLQKIMETVVLYGEALNAEKLIPIEGPGVTLLFPFQVLESRLP